MARKNVSKAAAVAEQPAEVVKPQRKGRLYRAICDLRLGAGNVVVSAGTELELSAADEATLLEQGAIELV